MDPTPSPASPPMSNSRRKRLSSGGGARLDAFHRRVMALAGGCLRDARHAHEDPSATSIGKRIAAALWAALQPDMPLRDLLPPDPRQGDEMGIRPTLPPRLAAEHTDVLASLGYRVATIRQALGFSQPELAARAGLRESHLHLVESGRPSLSLEALVRLAGAMGQSLHTLFGEVALGQADLPGLGGQLARTRDGRRWSLEQVSERSGISVSHLAAVENGKDGLSLHSLVAVALALEVCPADLIELEVR